MSDEELIEGLRVAMLGNSDGGFIDPDADIPAGEMFRLAGEYMLAVFRERTAPTDDDREALAGIIDAEFDEYRPVYNKAGQCVDSNAADRALAAGFRRGAPAEPAVTKDQETAVRTVHHIAQTTGMTSAEVVATIKALGEPAVTDEARERAVADLRKRYGASNGTQAWIEFQGDPHFIVNQVVAALEERGKP